MAEKQLGTNPANTTDAVTKAYVDAAVSGASPSSVTLKDTNFTLQDDGDTTKQMQFQLSGITAGQTRVLTVPDATTTLVGTTTSQPLTNKTISGASNTFSNLSQISITETISTSSTSSLTLTASNSSYVFTGSSAATWTLPAVSGNTGIVLRLLNRGTAAATVQRAGSDNLYYQGSTATSISMGVGASLTLVNDGTYWLVVTANYVFPTFDNTALSAKQSGVASGTAFTWSQTAAAGSYAIVAVYSANGGGTTLAATPVVSFGSTTLSSLGSVYCNNVSTMEWVWLFGANGVSGGSQTVSVKFTQSGKTFSGYASSCTYTNVSKVGALQTAFGNNTSAAVSVPTNVGASVVGIIGADAGGWTFTFSANFVQRQSYPGAFNDGSLGGFAFGDMPVTSGSSFNFNSALTAGATPTWAAAALSLS